jgi:hypothetical protein
VAVTGQSSISTATTLTREQVAGFARGAGFPDSQIPMAVAVAELESGRQPARVGMTDPRDLGLMQINSHYHPEVLGINWKDPGQNMRLAHTIWTHGGWSQWHTAGAAMLLSKTPAFTSTVKGSLGLIGQAVDTGASAVDAAMAPAKAALQIADLSARVGTFFIDPRNWERILFVLIGGVVVIVGAAVIVRPYAEPAVKAGMKVAAVAA